MALAGAKVAAERTKILLGCYPNGKPSDPQVYTAAVAAVLAQYPAEIVQRVTDPRVGVARRSKFMPSIAEIVAACDDEMRPLIIAHRDEQQIAAREEMSKPANQTMVQRFNSLLASITAYCSLPDPYLKPKREPIEQSTTETEAEVSG